MEREFPKRRLCVIFLIFHNKVNYNAALLSLQCVSSGSLFIIT